MIRALDLMIDWRLFDLSAEPVGDQKIVDPPSGVVLPRLVHVAPPGIAAGGVGMEIAEGIGKAGLQKSGEALALLVGEALPRLDLGFFRSIS